MRAEDRGTYALRGRTIAGAGGRGAILVVAVRKSHETIWSLEICRNPDMPVSQRTWSEVESLRAAAD